MCTVLENKSVASEQMLPQYLHVPGHGYLPRKEYEKVLISKNTEN